MNNRFGFRDVVLCGLLVAILVTMWLAMKQFDRQWELVRRVSEQLNQQTQEQARIKRELGELRLAVDGLATRPVTVVPGADAGQSPVAEVVPVTYPDLFKGMKAARELRDFAEGDWFVNSFSAKVARLTPLISTDAYASDVQERVLERLATRDPDTLDWMPVLARSWQISPDGLVITFQLRRGVTFSDGQPLTAHDVQFSYELIMNEAIDAPRARNYIKEKLASVVATRDDEVVFTFREPYFESFGLAAGLEVLPRHFYSTFTPDEINSQPGLLLGSGPYRLQSPTDWSPGKPLMLVRNERYWGEVRPAFDRLMWREINSEVARLTAFRNGEIDIFGAMPEQYLQIKDDPQINAMASFWRFERPVGGYGFIGWNQRRGGADTPFADTRVRQAMAMLFDRDTFNQVVMQGFAVFPTGPFNRLGKQYNEQVQPYPYDVAAAKSLLKEAGYEDRNGDGVIESADGRPLRFSVTFGAGDFWPKVMLLYKDSLAKAGIVMDLDPLEWAVFGEKVKSRDFDALAMAWTSGIEVDVHQMFHSSNIADGDNFISYRNPEVDRLIDEARRTMDETARLPMWKEVHRMLYEDQPYLFLYSREALVYIDKRIHNVHRNRLGLNDEMEWFVPQALQKWTRQ